MAKGKSLLLLPSLPSLPMVVGEVLMERTHSLREVYKEEYTWKSGGKQGGGDGKMRSWNKSDYSEGWWA